MNDAPQPPTGEGPTHLGEILRDVDAVLDHEPDAERQADAEVARLGAEVSELHDARRGMIEANEADEAEHDVTDITNATLDARADLDEAVKRHPANGPK